MPRALRTRRADAARNRVQLLDAACALFAVRGIDVPMGEIARVAGVGKGTAFRHFPSKDALLDAVLEARMRDAVGEVERFCEIDDAWDAFSAFAEFSVRNFIHDRALLETMCSARAESPDFEACRCSMEDAVTAVLDRAKAAGVVRRDIDITDIRQLLVAVAMSVPPARACEDDEQAWRRPLAIVLDGMRAPAVALHLP